MTFVETIVDAHLRGDVKWLIFRDESRFCRGPDNFWVRIRRGAWNETALITQVKFPMGVMVSGRSARGEDEQQSDDSDSISHDVPVAEPAIRGPPRSYLLFCKEHSADPDVAVLPRRRRGSSPGSGAMRRMRRSLKGRRGRRP
jgi:hypothetical protein